MSKFERILRRREVESRTGQSCSSIYADIAAGTFPAPVRRGLKSVGWLESEIDKHIEARVNERNERSKERAKQISKTRRGEALPKVSKGVA